MFNNNNSNNIYNNGLIVDILRRNLSAEDFEVLFFKFKYLHA